MIFNAILPLGILCTMSCTGPFIILESQVWEIHKFYDVRKRRSTDFEAFERVGRDIAIAYCLDIKSKNNIYSYLKDTFFFRDIVVGRDIFYVCAV